MHTDSELIAKVIVKGEHQAFNGLVVKYQSGVRQFLRRLTAGDHALADDIAQDVFIIAFQKLSQFKGTGSFSGWLRKLAYHRFIRVIQTGANKYESPCDVSWQSLQTSDSIEADILAESLMKMLEPDERMAITLNVSEGFSHSEISNITGVPLGTVKSFIARAKDKLNKVVQSNEQVVA